MKPNKKSPKSAPAGSDSAGMLHDALATRAEKRPNVTSADLVVLSNNIKNLLFDMNATLVVEGNQRLMLVSGDVRVFFMDIYLTL